MPLSRQQFITAAGSSALAFATPGSAMISEEIAKAKRIIYLCQSGAPSQLDLFDEKKQLRKWAKKELPDSIRGSQRLTGMTSNQESFPVAPTKYAFRSCGQSGMRLSELLPHLSEVADELCLIRSMHTEAINHDPAITFLQTGFQQAGRPSLGAWLGKALKNENKDLPGFIVLSSRGSGRPNCQPLYERLWGSGFLPSKYQGVKFQNVGDPVLYLSDPKGVPSNVRKVMIDAISKLNEQKFKQWKDEEILTRSLQYQLAGRMQKVMPEIGSLKTESKAILNMYGPDVKRKGSYAYNCLLARKLAESGVKAIQLFHMGWDQHNALPTQLPGQCRDVDQPTAALLKDLKQRGLLEDTLVVWTGEFGRTVYCQGPLTKDNYGRDHHPRCFSMFLAGAGIKKGYVHGLTDDFSYNILDKPMHVHDLNATLLHILGIHHEKLTYRHQGRDYRLTDVHGHVVRDILL